MPVDRSNPFDKASRCVAKIDPAGFLSWHSPGLDTALQFTSWLDTRTLPMPGEPDRVCDTVAGLSHATDPAQCWALVVEFKIGPERGMVEQLLEYLVRMRRELRPSAPGPDQYQVAGTLVLLTGSSAKGKLDMELPGTDMRLLLQVHVRCLEDEDAARTLQAIGEGRLGRWILPWVPLMQGGGGADNIARWRELALAEPDSRHRSDYGAFASVFAELMPWKAAWREALKGWNMRESQQVLEWQAEARAEGLAEGLAEGQRKFLLRTLERQFHAPVPDDLKAVVETLTDPDELARWHDMAFTAPTLDAYRAAVLQGRNGSS